LNAEESLEALEKATVDDYDLRMREGLGLLQVLVMQNCPSASEGKWSQMLKRIAVCESARSAVTRFLLESINKKDLYDEVEALISANLQYLTPTTVWLLKHNSFKLQKSQQHVRLKASFTIVDCFEEKIDHLINFSALIKSPAELTDTWLKAVIRSKVPLSYKQVKTKYWEALQHIAGPAELSQIKG